MKLYVASKFQNYPAVRVAIDKITGRGHEVTFDWTRGEGFDPATGHALSYNDESPLDVQVRSAEADLAGVRRADAVLVLAYPGMCGGMAEFGIALGLGKPIAVVDPGRCFTVFYRIAHVSLHATVDAALLALGAVGTPRSLAE